MQGVEERKSDEWGVVETFSSGEYAREMVSRGHLEKGVLDTGSSQCAGPKGGRVSGVFKELV